MCKNLTRADRGEGGGHKNLTFADGGGGGGGGAQNGKKNADVINERPLRNLVVVMRCEINLSVKLKF